MASFQLEKYGVIWNTQPLKNSIENKDANIQANLI